MTYMPYTQEGTCKPASQVATDIASIRARGFSTVRLYANDCSAAQTVGAACAVSGLKMILGIYVDDDGTGDSVVREQVAELADWGRDNWDLVELVVVGNEALYNDYLSADALAQLIHATRDTLAQAGYSGPVTTTEPMSTMERYGATLCPAIDIVTANIHPFFDGRVTAAQAGDFVAEQLARLSRFCNDEKEAFSLETGWPSHGKANGQAVPGVVEQRVAIKGIMRAAGARTVIASFEDDVWREPGDLGVEQYWGVGGLFSQVL